MATAGRRTIVIDITPKRSAEKPIVMSGAAVTDILKHADSMQV